MNAVQLVTIKSKTPLFKGEEKAERIELINLKEVGFDLVSQKDLYQIGDKAVFIQPDYCLSDISLFESFIRPNGDESKSMLGKVGGLARRIRAKSFNFHKGDGEKVYSNGILLPLNEVKQYLKDVKGYMFELDSTVLTRLLEITKYEEPEETVGGVNVGKASKFPEGIYKTDETNILNRKGVLQFPVTLVGTEKIDGSSITLIQRNGCDTTICSRNMAKPYTYMKVVGTRKKTLLEKILFWTKPDLKLYEEVENIDDFIKYGKPLLEKIKCKLLNVVLRGELSGGSLKGSGNKNNPARLEQPNIKLFGIDSIGSDGIARKLPHEQFKIYATEYDLPTVKEVFLKEFNSFDDMIKECNDYFKENMIEGIVIRTLDSKFSAKVMNLQYDSKK